MEIHIPVPGELGTMYEGYVHYDKLWNFWVRHGVQVTVDLPVFFRDYEAANADTNALLRAIKGGMEFLGEEEVGIWLNIGKLWNWLKANIPMQGGDVQIPSSVPDTWPSILDYAKYYVKHRHLAWAACFSRAHLFATLLGRMMGQHQRFRCGIAAARYPHEGALAQHVFVGAYVSGRWFYLDPTSVFNQNVTFPDYAHRQSIGVAAIGADYEHPYEFIPLPLSQLNGVPYLHE
jgi:hypothetical protein